MKYDVNMETYDAFAYVYDELMDNIPYTEWCDVIDKMICKYGISKKTDRKGNTGVFDALKYDDIEMAAHKELTEEEILESEKNLVVDLGCGTGTLTNLMYKKGYDYTMTHSASAYTVHLTAVYQSRRVKEMFITVDKKSYNPTEVKLLQKQKKLIMKENNLI